MSDKQKDAGEYFSNIPEGGIGKATTALSQESLAEAFKYFSGLEEDMAQHIPEVGDIFMVTHIGGETDGPFKRVETEEPEPGVIYGVQWARKGLHAFGIKDCVFMDAPGGQESMF